MKGFPDNIHRVKIRSILIILPLLYAYNCNHLKFKENLTKLLVKYMFRPYICALNIHQKF
jgi:hypothetical protein